MIENTLTYTFPAAFALLPGGMNTPSARAMLLAIGLQESQFKARRQGGGGPARGFWQFEKNGGVRATLEHSSTKLHIAHVCSELHYKPAVDIVYVAIEHNDTLACCLARLLLWTLPSLLPERGMPERAWRQYIDAWRPGKPHRHTWNDNFAKAWTLVEP